MKKYLIVLFLLIAGYSYAQEVPGWIDTTISATSAAKYKSVSNAQPLPVNTLGPVLRLQDSLYFGTPGDSIWVYNFQGKYNFIEVAWTDTGLAADSVLPYLGIPGVTDTSWSLVGAVNLSTWNVETYIAPGLSTTKQWWIKTTRPYLVKLVLSNATRTATQKGSFKVEAK